jgi:chorismate mutase
MDSMTANLATAATERQEAQKALDTLKANFDAATAKVTALEEVAKTVEASFDSKLQEAVSKRLELVAKVAKVCTIDGLEAKTDKEIMLAAIVAKHPSFDGADKSADYLQARFDAVVEEAAKAPSVPASIAKQRQGSMDSAPAPSKAVLTGNLFEAWAAS